MNHFPENNNVETNRAFKYNIRDTTHPQNFF